MSEWQPIKTAPRDGTRIRVRDGVWSGDAWYEENLKDFMCMDSEWNLIKLGDVTVLHEWTPLPLIEDQEAP